jgi:hypothetical protein
VLTDDRNRCLVSLSRLPFVLDGRSVGGSMKMKQARVGRTATLLTPFKKNVGLLQLTLKLDMLPPPKLIRMSLSEPSRSK